MDKAILYVPLAEALAWTHGTSIMERLLWRGLKSVGLLGHLCTACIASYASRLNGLADR